MTSVVTAPGLGAEYRLYSTGSGRYVRVRVDMVNVAGQNTAATRHFKLLAEEADENGVATGMAMPAFMLTQMLSEIDEAPLMVEESLPQTVVAGDLVIVNGILFCGHDGAWQDCGPIDSGASASFAETIAMLDFKARELVQKAERSFARRSADSELTQMFDNIN